MSVRSAVEVLHAIVEVLPLDARQPNQSIEAHHLLIGLPLAILAPRSSARRPSGSADRFSIRVGAWSRSVESSRPGASDASPCANNLDLSENVLTGPRACVRRALDRRREPEGDVPSDRPSDDADLERGDCSRRQEGRGHVRQKRCPVDYWSNVRERLAKFAHALAYLNECALITAQVVQIDERARERFEAMHHQPGWLERRKMDRLLDEYENALSTQLIKYGLLEDWLQAWERRTFGA